jgi:hypothetical protein
VFAVSGAAKQHVFAFTTLLSAQTSAVLIAGLFLDGKNDYSALQRVANC